MGYEPTVTKLSPGMEAVLKRAGISRDEYRDWLTSPGFITKLHRDMEQKLQFALASVWDSLVEAAVDKKDVAAIKLFMHRFDRGYQDVLRKENHVQPVDLPAKDDFLRMMRARYGDAEVDAALSLAQKHGVREGAFQEEYLPGGELEDHADAEEIDAVVLDDDPGRRDEDEPASDAEGESDFGLDLLQAG